MAAGLTIPRDLDGLTPEWVTTALHATGTIDHVVVTAIDHQALAEGHGFTGRIVRLRLGFDGDESGAPRSLIAKLPAADAAVRATLNELGLYACEVRVYQAFAQRPDAPLPRVYYADIDPGAAASIILLEDLASGHVGDNVGGCTAAEAMLAVSELARFQAAWWDHPRLAEMPWLLPGDPHRYQQVCQQQWGRFTERLGDILPPRLKSIGAAAVEQAAVYRRWLCSPPQTIMHGDFRLDNLFFGDAGAARPVTLFDWQLSVLGRGIGDVAYFAAFCLPVVQRRAIERGLVERYHDALAAAGVRGYDAARCWRDYQSATLGALFRLITAGGIVDFSSARGWALIQALVERTDAILADHRVGELLADDSLRGAATEA
jgi:hypothetical protein